jgi:hypothetical protein
VARARRAVEDFSAQAVALGQKHAADPASAEADLQTYFQDAARTFAPGVSLERMVPEVQDFGLGGATTSPFRMRASGASRHEVAILRGLAGLYNNARLLGGAAGRAPVPTPGTNIGKTNLDFVAVPMFSDGSDLPGTKKAFDQLRDKAVHALDANSEMPVQVVFPLSQGLSRRDAERAVRKALVDRLGSSRGNSAFAKLSLMVGDQFMTNGAVDMEKVANEVSPNWRNSFNLRLTAVATEGILLDAVRNAITLFLINLLTGEPQPVSVEQGAEALRYADINA